MHESRALESVHVPLRLTYGLIPVLAGLDKFTNLLADWPGYLSPAIAGILPLSPSTFMHIVGLIEVAVGVLILTRWTRLGAYVAAVWLLSIAANLVLAGYYDIAVRDVAMAVGAWTLARITEARAELEVPAAHPSRQLTHVAA